MLPMNFTEWLRHKQTLVEMELDNNYSNGQTEPDAALTRTANKIVAKSPEAISKIGSMNNPKKANQSVMKIVGKQQPHMNVNQKKNIQIGDIAKAVKDVAGVEE